MILFNETLTLIIRVESSIYDLRRYERRGLLLCIAQYGNSNITNENDAKDLYD